MNERIHREQITRGILFGNLFIFLLLFVLYLNGAFLEDHFFNILKLLVPVKTVYLTPLVKFTILSKRQKIRSSEVDNISTLYALVTRILIGLHILILILLIVLKATNQISFDFILGALSIVEGLFGAYIGLIIMDLYKAERT